MNLTFVVLLVKYKKVLIYSSHNYAIQLRWSSVMLRLFVQLKHQLHCLFSFLMFCFSIWTNGFITTNSYCACFLFQSPVRFSTAKITLYVEHQPINNLGVSVLLVQKIKTPCVEVMERLTVVNVRCAERRVWQRDHWVWNRKENAVGYWSNFCSRLYMYSFTSRTYPVISILKVRMKNALFI